MQILISDLSVTDMADNSSYDVVVAGGGMVGAAAALALAQAGFSVLVLDHAPPVAPLPDAPPDLRVSAISCASVELLRRLGAWERIGEEYRVPYRRLETWEWDASRVTFDAAALRLPELGFMVENYRVQRGLWQAFEACDSLRLLCPASLTAMSYDGGNWRLALDNGETVTTRLLIGADGAQSRVRRQAGIGVSGWQYRQSCLLITVACPYGQQDTTWQEFSPDGPRAFLPLYNQWAALVWYDSAARIKQLQALSLPALEREVLRVFPRRLGAVKVHAAGAFPLVRSHARRYVNPGLALIGDAAHTINPLAGQGVNLGFRDVEALADVVAGARDHGEPWDELRILKRYQHRRYADNLLMQSGMDLFYTAFSNNLPPVKLARNLGLMLAQRAGALKTRALKYALGL
ncbi:2-octaprenyl-3-methyl-6-methoxy-1,4-benzoquinol hydroxylase [Sodalis ligni]|jgi:2-octaprenyl-3-methyl-6-methoxy-1,4-benzoquinol hydroxylase|uniref:2-octaprenyl-3-methyl-6-methoxy-1,4-benzoquinol hydroxylase n=2 Tax=Sodalis ligni TaxID=2697027 RepID=A0A4R1NH10_9GAMM|nr:2-octaprenyl-3-methyl-6-methoxy-1,4-benzoquinol hydroxylase [Sodalis ligni]